VRHPLPGKYGYLGLRAMTIQGQPAALQP